MVAGVRCIEPRALLHHILPCTIFTSVPLPSTTLHELGFTSRRADMLIMTYANLTSSIGTSTGGWGTKATGTWTPTAWTSAPHTTTYPAGNSSSSYYPVRFQCFTTFITYNSI